MYCTSKRADVAQLTFVLLLSTTFLCSVWGIDCSFTDTLPKQLTSYKVNSADIVIDGKLDERAWQEIQWTDDFVDISTNVTPRFRTRAKVRWNEYNLYVAAELGEPDIWGNITHTCHCIDNTTDQIIYHDNDFEIFVDADGTTHNYKEFEVNALNQTWILLLNKPYADGGYENSSRVFGSAGFDMQPPLTCGTNVQPAEAINNPKIRGDRWTVEIALPVAKLLELSHSEGVAPKYGDTWRINFSRVEWRVKVVDDEYVKDSSHPIEDNWVWSPQGEIQMHLPERWGMLHLAEFPPAAGSIDDANSASDFWADWTVRQVAMAVYYAEHSYAARHDGQFTTDVSALAEHLSWPVEDSKVLSGECASIPAITFGNSNKNFEAKVVSLDGTVTASITDDRLLTTQHLNEIGLPNVQVV